MQQIKFLYDTLGPFDGLSDGTSFMDCENIFIDDNIRNQIVRTLKKTDSVRSHSLISNLTSMPRGPDGLYCLSDIHAKRLEGYFVLEFKDNRDYSLATAKEIFLDGHRFDIYIDKPYWIKEFHSPMIWYGYEVTLHNKFNHLEDAQNYITEQGASMRTSAFKGEVDSSINRNEVIQRRYMHPQYRVGDLGKSVGEIPREILQMSSFDVKQWANRMLEQAKKFEPEVYWHLGTATLERRVQRAISD